MSSMFDASDEPLSEEDSAAVKQNAKERLRLWQKRFAFSGAAFFLNCAAIAPFLAGHFLHGYWETFGKLLLLLSMGFFLSFVYCGALLWGAWTMLHDLKRV
jgi:hypothetical protein